MTRLSVAVALKALAHSWRSIVVPPGAGHQNSPADRRGGLQQIRARHRVAISEHPIVLKSGDRLPEGALRASALTVRQAEVPAPYGEWALLRAARPLPEPADPPNFGPASRFGELGALRSAEAARRRALVATAERAVAAIRCVLLRGERPV